MPEIVSSGRAANSARCARAFLSLCPNRDRVGLRQPRCLPDDGPDVGGGVLNHWADGARTELEANLNAAGALERYQYWSDKLERLLQQQRSRASHDRYQPQFPSDYRQSSERGRARARVLCPKTDRRDENGHVAECPPSPIDIAGQSASSPAVPTSEPTNRHAVEAELAAKFRSNPSLLAAGGIAAIGIRGSARGPLSLKSLSNFF